MTLASACRTNLVAFAQKKGRQGQGIYHIDNMVRVKNRNIYVGMLHKTTVLCALTIVHTTHIVLCETRNTTTQNYRLCYEKLQIMPH